MYIEKSKLRRSGSVLGRIILNLLLLSLIFIAPGFAATDVKNIEIEPAVKLTEAEKAWIKAHPVLKVASESNWPPFEYIDEQKRYKGISADLLQLVCKRVGLKIEPVFDQWSTLLERLQAKELDLNPGFNKTPEREKYLIFTEEWANNSNSIIRQTKRTQITTFDSLLDKTIAVEKDYNLHEHYKKQYPNLKLHVVPSTLDALRAVSANKADAYIGPHWSSLYLIERNNLSDLQVSGFYDLSPQRLYMGMRNDYPILRDILQKGLDSVSNIERQQIINRYINLKSVTAAQQKIELTEKEKNWVDKHPTIRVHNEMDWPPFNYNEEGKPIGLSIEYMNMIAERIGIKVDYISGPSWNEFLGMLKKKDLDVMLNIVKTPEREKYILYTQPYISNPNVIINREDAPYNSIESLKGKRVAIPKGFFYEELLKKHHPDIKRISTTDQLESLKAVIFGKADAALGELAVMEYLIDQHVLKGLHISGEVKLGDPDIENLRIGVRNDWPELQNILKKAMAKITPQEMRALKQRWLGDTRKELEVQDRLVLPKQVDFDQATFLIKSIAVVLALLLAVIFVIWLIRGRPKQLTIREVLAFVSLVFVGLIVSIGIFVTMLLDGAKKDSKIEARKYDSLNLAIELKQSSDDLTRFARTFAVTGKPEYEKYFMAIIAIRDGKQARPKIYARSYWDQVTGGIVELDEDGKTYSIEEKILELGLTEKEREKLSQAKKESDKLIALETVAMNAVKGLYKDAEGKFSAKGEPDLEMARNILHGKAYHEAKAKTMKPIDEFFTLLNWRTTNEQNLVNERNHAIILGITGLTLTTICFSIYIFFLLKRRVVTPLSRLETGAQTIEGGNYTHHIEITSKDEMGALATAFNSMASSIEERTAELEEAQKHFQQLIEAAPDGFIAVDTNGTIVLTNAESEKLFGYTKEQMIGSQVEMLVPSQGQEKHVALRDEYFKSPEVKSMGVGGDIEVLHADGKTIPVEISLSPIKTSQGMLSVAAIRDITERKQAEEGLRKLTRAVEDNPMAVIITDLQGTIEYVNPKFTDITGYESDEVIGQNPRILKSGEHPPEFFKELWETILAGKEWHGEFLNKRKNGELQWQSAIIAPIIDEKEEITHFVSIQEDISEKKKAAEELLKLSNAIEHSPVSVVITNHEGTIEYVNPSFSEVTGYSKEEAIGKNPRILNSGKQSQEFYKNMWKTISSGHNWTGEFINRKKSGENYWEIANISPVKNSQNKITHYVAVKEDITERKAVEEALRTSEEKTRLVLESVGDGIFGVDLNGKVVFVNTAAGKLLGYDPVELIGQNVHEKIHHTHADGSPYPVETCPMSKSYTTGTTEIISDEMLWRKDGTGLSVEYTATPIKKEGTIAGAVIAFRDITERKKTDRELRDKIERLARFRRHAIGRESKMIVLKKEINELLNASGKSQKYKIR